MKIGNMIMFSVLILLINLLFSIVFGTVYYLGKNFEIITYSGMNLASSLALKFYGATIFFLVFTVVLIVIEEILEGEG